MNKIEEMTMASISKAKKKQESDDDAELACGVLVNYTSYDKTFIMGIKRYCSSKALPWVFAI